MFMAVDLPEPFTPRSSSRPPPKCSTSFSYWYTFTIPARFSRHRGAPAPKVRTSLAARRSMPEAGV